MESRKARETLNTLRVLCGPMRFKIILALQYAGKDGLSTTDLARLFDTNLSRVSHQLAILKRHNLVESRKRNREQMYRLKDHRVHKLF